MTEFDKQIPKQGAQTADAQFMGLLEPAKTGTGAKGEWKKSKVSFQITGKEKPNKFVFWNQKPESKSQYKTIEELKQFETYRIVWYEKDESYNNQEWVSKTIQVIKDHDENDAATTQQPQGQPQSPAAQPKATANDWVQFQTDYNSKDSKGEKSATHMLGMYVFNKHKGQFGDIIALCKKNFEK